MKHLQLLLCILFLVQAVIAQDTDTDPDRKTIRLKTYNLDEVQLNKVAAIEIMPVQWDTARLGFAQVGISNRRIEAVPALPYGQYLQEYINRQYGNKFNPAGVHLLWVMKDVRINERTFQVNERGFCRVKADAYISSDGNRYIRIPSFDTVTIRNGMDVTSQHDENIARALHMLLQHTLEKGLPMLEGYQVTLIKEDIKAIVQATMSMPILTDEVYTEGIYMSFSEFRANKPSLLAFSAEKVKKKMKLFTVDANGNKVEVSNAWGFCMKGELYRTIDDAIIPIEKSGHGFVISKYLQSAKRRNQAMFWSAVGGGMIGSAIATNAMKAYMVNTIPYITRQQPEATALDMDTGELTL